MSSTETCVQSQIMEMVDLECGNERCNHESVSDRKNNENANSNTKNNIDMNINNTNSLNALGSRPVAVSVLFLILSVIATVWTAGGAIGVSDMAYVDMDATMTMTHTNNGQTTTVMSVSTKNQDGIETDDPHVENTPQILYGVSCGFFLIVTVVQIAVLWRQAKATASPTTSSLTVCYFSQLIFLVGLGLWITGLAVFMKECDDALDSQIQSQTTGVAGLKIEGECKLHDDFYGGKGNVAMIVICFLGIVIYNVARLQIWKH